MSDAARAASGLGLELPAVVEQAERAVLGSMLIEDRAAKRGAEMLLAADFHRETHRKMFAALTRIVERDQAADIVTLSEELRRTKDLGTLGPNAAEGGALYITKCLDSVATAAHIEHYARLVKEASYDRQIASQLRVTDKAKTAENVKKLHDLMTAYYGVRHDRVFDFRKDLNAALDELTKGAPTAVDLGFPALDRLLGGLEPGDVTTVGARTSGGKTAFMTKAAVQLAERGHEVLYITTEMTEVQMLGRVLPMATQIPAWKFRRRRLDIDDHRAIMKACAERLSKLPLKIFGRPTVGLTDIRATCAQAKPRFVFVDYLQRCRYPEGDTRAYQVQDFMAGLKTFAQESRLNVVIGAQLDRKLDKTPDAEPENADLRDSGGIEHESVQIVLLWKPSQKVLDKDPGHTPPPADHHCVRGKVTKNRYGGAGKHADFMLNGPLVEIVERLAPRQQQEDLWTDRSDTND